MNLDNFKKILLKQSHDNTHSVGRIKRAAEYLMENEIIDKDKKAKLFKDIFEGASECYNQMDIIYDEFKKLK